MSDESKPKRKIVDVGEIVAEYLEAHGYDGLCDEDNECGCLLEDLAPCGEVRMGCQAGWRVPCDPTDGDFYITTERQNRQHERALDVERIEAERDDFKAKYEFMVNRAANEKLDGYQELGARAAAAENLANDLRRRLLKMGWIPPEGRSVSEHCRMTHQQACGHCDDLACGDNTSKEKLGFDIACEVVSGGDPNEVKGCIDTLEICDPITEGNTLHASLNESYAEKKK